MFRNGGSFVRTPATLFIQVASATVTRWVIAEVSYIWSVIRPNKAILILILCKGTYHALSSVAPLQSSSHRDNKTIKLRQAQQSIYSTVAAMAMCYDGCDPAVSHALAKLPLVSCREPVRHSISHKSYYCVRTSVRSVTLSRLLSTRASTDIPNSRLATL